MAIQWNAPNPARADQLPHIPLERVKPAGKVTGAITTNTVLGVNLHFMRGRTLPCTGEHCPGCAAHLRNVWEGYLGIYTSSPSRHIILALTPGAALALSDAAANPNLLRGRWITVTRRGNRQNGKVMLTLDDRSVEPHHLPPLPDLERHLFKIWGLDAEHMAEDHPLFECREQFTLPMTVADGEGQRKAK